MITAITLTGDRPLAFSLCQKWMSQQTMQPDQWIIVDDGKTEIMPKEWPWVRREPLSSDPQNTMGLNLSAALPHISGDKIIIIEDDDYYAPTYIAEMSRRLDKFDVVGITESRYYHLPSGGYMSMGNVRHASFAETAFRSSYLPELKAFAFRGLFPTPLDIIMWRKLRLSNRSLLFSDADRFLHLGIKGLPGRPGLGVGHRATIYRNHDNQDRAVLKKWVPKDYQAYLDILGTAA